MEHIEEGRIHAWLDGALPDAETARVEAHVAACPACAAAVAEARGLIAASSRILAALDDVPGGVIPAAARGEATAAARTTAAAEDDAGAAGAMGAAGAPATRRAVELRPTVRRPWYLRPQWAAAAGISFLAVASTVVWQRASVSSVADFAREAAPAAPSISTQADSAPAARGRDEADARALGAAAAPGEATADASGNAVQSSERKRTVAAAPAAGSERAAGASAASASAMSASAMSASANAQSTAKETAPVDRTATKVAAEARDDRSGAREPVVPPAPPMAVREAPAGALRAKVAEDTSALAPAPARRLALSADAIVRTESARVAGERDAQRAALPAQVRGVVVTGGGAATARTQARDNVAGAPPPTVASLAGCYRVPPRAAGLALEVGELLELDAVAAGQDESRPAYVARDLITGLSPSQQLRAPLRWTLTATGQVTLVRGNGEQAQRLTLELRTTQEAPDAGGVVRATRVPCPMQ